MRRIGMVSVFSFALILIAAPAFAGPGLHAGFSIDPHDFLIGLHFRKPIDESLTLVPSVEAGFGDITRDDGSKQLAYGGKPLYYYANDAKPGDRNGDKLQNVWFVAVPGAAKAAASAPPRSTASGY